MARIFGPDWKNISLIKWILNLDHDYFINVCFMLTSWRYEKKNFKRLNYYFNFLGGFKSNNYGVWIVSNSPDLLKNQDEEFIR